MSRKLAVLLIGSLPALVAVGGAWAEDGGQIVESGSFRLHLYKRPTGRETYEIQRDGESLILRGQLREHRSR